jgi:hypothetical protein
VCGHVWLDSDIGLAAPDAALRLCSSRFTGGEAITATTRRTSHAKPSTSSVTSWAGMADLTVVKRCGKRSGVAPNLSAYDALSCGFPLSG